MSGWPRLTVESDHETLALLHLASQLLGKLRVAHAPWMNHGWHVTLRPAPFFYSYAYPEPPALRARPLPVGAWDDAWKEFTLDYEEVRASRDPEGTLMRFLQSTYEAAADLAGWDRAGLEREPVAPWPGRA